MPTPTGDCVTLSLQKALTGRKGAGDEQGSELDNLLSVRSKQALTTDIEYELAENQYANSLSNMKFKYICFASKVAKKNGLSLSNSSFHNGNGVKNGCTNGVKNGNGVKVHPEAVLPKPKYVLYPPEKVELGWRTKGPPGAGMHNMGNTCYLNSILQALFHVPAFVSFLSNDVEHRERCEVENGPSCGDCLTCALAKTLQSSRSQDIIRPELITSKLRLISRSLSYGAEEDAHEFMRCLLSNIENGYYNRFSRKKLDDSCTKETTPIHQIFGGYIRQEVTCRSCGYVSTTFQHFQDLMLDIRKASKVDDALDQHFCKEVLDGPDAYTCEVCKQRTAATKKCSIEKPPKVLCVQLKRFTGSGTKIMKSVDVKLQINLQKYLNAASKYTSSTKYKLIAFVTHSGSSSGGGHYTAIAQTPNSSYYLFDDATVRPVTLSSTVTTTAYILFFELEPARSINGQRENQPVNKATPSTITSNGSISSNGSAYPQFKKWDPVAWQPQTPVQPHLIVPTKKVKPPFVEKGNRPEGEQTRNENRPGFIGPRLPTEAKPASRVPETPSLPPLNNDENATRKRLNDGTVKVPEEKKEAKVPSLVPYDDDDTTGSESSPSTDASQPLTAKATTPQGWQVKVNRSPSVSSEGSTKTKWNVTSRSSPSIRKVNNCSNDCEIEPNGDKSRASASSLDRNMGEKVNGGLANIEQLPPSTVPPLKNGVQDCVKKKNDVERETDRTHKDSRPLWNIPQNRSRTPYKNDEGGDCHPPPWRNDSANSHNGNGGPNRNHSFNRNISSNNGVAERERGMQNGHSHKMWSKDSSDVVSHLNRQSHTGFSNSARTWNNERSTLDKPLEEDERLSRKRENEYDDYMDRGRTKKMKHHKEFSRINHFDQYQRNRNGQNYYSKNNHNRFNNGYTHHNKRHPNNNYRMRNGGTPKRFSHKNF